MHTIFGRYFDWTTVSAPSFSAERQYIHTKQDLYSRGSIYFTTKEGEKVSAASVRSGYVLALNPSKITNPETLCDALSTHAEVTTERCVDRATLEGRTYVELNSTVDEEAADAIAALKLDGVHLYRNQWRYYPGGSMSARSIGG